jgi:Fimbrial assembly protein (PilN)
MRITAHLSSNRPRLALPLAALLWVSALGFGVLAAWLAIDGFDSRAERPRLEARLARAQEQLSAAASGESLPAAAEMEALRRRVQALNKVSGLRGWGTPQLLGWLGNQLPDNVYLVSLAHKPRDGEALLVAESPSAEALTRFLLRLEKEPGFAEVLLSKQSARGGPGAAAVQFEIRVRWKP